MDWNNINRDRDTSGLGPIEYDQSKVPELIRKHADNVRTKTYGQEVREAQARNAEMAGLIASEAVDISNETKGRQDTVETQFNSVQQELTDKDVISAPEIIAARNGEETLSDRLNNEYQKIDRKLLDDAISPDDFEGTDYDKIQQAIDSAITTKKGIKFSRFYDLTGDEPLMINKPSSDRSPICFYGIGGGIVKNDAGYIFTGLDNTGDIHVVDMNFRSVAGAGTIIFNNNMLIRIKWINSVARYVDTVMRAETKFFQSCHISGGSIIGGKGYAFETPGAFDFTCSNSLLVEHRDGFFKQTVNAEAYTARLHSARFRDIIVEGLNESAFRLRGVEGLTIDGVYLEGNKEGHIVFEEGTYGLDGVEISNLRVYEREENAELLTAVIEWNGNANSVNTSGIISRNLPIHSTERVKNGYVYSASDRAILTSGTRLENIGNRVITLNNFGIVNDVTTYPYFQRLNAKASGTINSGQNVEVNVFFDRELSRDDIISIQTTSNPWAEKLIIRKYYIAPDNKKNLKVSIGYEGTNTAQAFLLYVTALKFNVSTTG